MTFEEAQLANRFLEITHWEAVNRPTAAVLNARQAHFNLMGIWAGQRVQDTIRILNLEDGLGNAKSVTIEPTSTPPPEAPA